MGVILYVLACMLSFILNPFFIIYAIIRLKSWDKINRYFFELALGKDQLGNICSSICFNDILIAKDGIRFGNPDLTISGILGENKIRGKLKFLGKFLCWILNLLEKDHVEKSIGN